LLEWLPKRHPKTKDRFATLINRHFLATERQQLAAVNRRRDGAVRRNGTLG